MMSSNREILIRSEAQKILDELQNGERDWGAYNFDFGFGKGELINYYLSRCNNELDEQEIEEIISNLTNLSPDSERFQRIKIGKEYPSITELRNWALESGADETVYLFVPLESKGSVVGWAIIRRYGPDFHEEYDLIQIFNSEAEMKSYYDLNYD